MRWRLAAGGDVNVMSVGSNGYWTKRTHPVRWVKDRGRRERRGREGEGRGNRYDGIQQRRNFENNFSEIGMGGAIYFQGMHTGTSRLRSMLRMQPIT